MEQTKTWQQIWEGIDKLDLKMIKFKLCDPTSENPWDPEYADRVEEEYRRFLKLVVKYAPKPITTNMVVDTFWHGHILDTEKYAKDCQATFGYFMHHYPYFGMEGEEDLNNYNTATDETFELYEKEFQGRAWAGTF